MSNFDYDLFVIGAGSGGVRAARLCAQLGLKVGIAEEYRVGGTCVIRGCVPKKLLVYASRLGLAIEDARGFGWQVGETTFDWPTLIANKDREIGRLSGVYTTNLNKAGVELFLTRAVVQDAHHIRLGEPDKSVSAEKILVSTGGRAFLPDVPGIKHAITSNEAFHLERLPRSVAIIGGGYIAVEFATIFAGLGSAVTLVYRGRQILRDFDDDLAQGLSHALRSRGIDILVERDVSAIEKENGEHRITFREGGPITAEKIMFATGRVPNTEGLGLQKANVELGWRGDIIVDEYSQSSVDNIYAVGDVTHRVNLTPVAISEAVAFVETVFKDNPTPVDHDYIPTAVFSEPEIGTVGMTEKDAREMHKGEIDIYKSSFKPMLSTLGGRDEKMLMKLVVDARSECVLGCHILGPDAAEIVQIMAIALRLGAKKSDLDATMALHPSAAEELVTMSDKWQPAAAE